MADYHLTVLTRFSVQLPSIAHIVQAGESPPNELDQASLDLPLPVSVGRTVSRQAPALEPGVLDFMRVLGSVLSDTPPRLCASAASFASLLYAPGGELWRGHDSVPTVVEEEKHANTISMQTRCLPLRCHARCGFHASHKGKNGPRLVVGIPGSAATPTSFDA